MLRILQWPRQSRRREANSKNNEANEMKLNSKNTYDRYLLVDSYMRWSNTDGAIQMDPVAGGGEKRRGQIHTNKSKR